MSTYVATTLAIGFGLTTVVLLLAMLKPVARKRFVDVVVIALIGWTIWHNVKKPSSDVRPSDFAQAVDLEPIQNLAVQATGRVKSFDSFARTMMRYVSGPRRIAGQSPAFTYLDLMFRPEAYRDADIIFVKKKQIRQSIAEHLRHANAADESVLKAFQKTGLISQSLLVLPVVAQHLDELEKDLMRTNKPVNEIRSALSVARPATLAGNLRVIPPPGGTDADPWYLIGDVLGSMPGDAAHAGMNAQSTIPGLDPNLQTQVTRTWDQLRNAWAAQNAGDVNESAAKFASLVRSVEPSVYPEQAKIKLENQYFRYKGLTWNWIIYALAAIPFLMAVIYHWNGARYVGIALFVIAFAIHTTSLGLRWHISGRIPNSNMFEAITAATWFGALFAFVIEFLTRRTAMRSTFFLGAAVAAMVASMCTHFMPVTLSSDIDNIMPILHDVWLYIHTNMIIWSYALIGMATIPALLYLRHRLGGGPPDAAVLGGAGSLIMTGKRSFIGGARTTFAQVLDGSTMVLMELSFITLWTGLVMGAIWADHSWGRPWGWDPKEVFALNTFIVFLVLVHVRFKVKDKGLWTAVLATVGCGVMLFNWIVINFVITGLHSYA